MSIVSKAKGFLAAMSAVASAGFAPAAWASPGSCSDLHLTHSINPGTDLFTQFVGPVRFVAGDVLTLTMTATGTGTPTIALGTSYVASAVGGPSTVSLTVPETGTLNLSWGFDFGFTATTSGTISLSCASGSTSTAITIQQTINNANSAIQNGQQTLQNFNDWISKGMQTSFSPSGASGNTAAARRLAPLSARAKVLTLRQDEQVLVEELATKPDGDADLMRRLEVVRRDLRYASATVGFVSAPSAGTWRDLEPAPVPERERSALTESLLARQRLAQTNGTPAQESTRVHDGPIGSAPAPSRPTPMLSVNNRDLDDFCDADCEVVGKQWNVWLEGRAVGAIDSLAQTNSLGFVGSAGGDYKVLPWLALGLSVGAETFETKFGNLGVRAGTVGVSAVPYVGIRLDDNIFATGFVGLTRITYNTNPAAGINASFNALRVLVGGSLTGIWREGAWRFQPSVGGTYGRETQNSYVDSANNNVAGQVVSYGRLSVGPEVGYTFTFNDKSLSVEPFVLGRANLDFASSNAVLLNGQSVVLRPGTLGSGTVGGGVEMRFDAGYYVRAQGSYDSIGVTGLDAWSALIRGGLRF